MHSTVFHFPFSAISYVITGLSSNDVLSICNPQFNLKADYTFTQTSSTLVTDADINFEWIQTSGTPVLEFVNANTSEPTVLVDPSVNDDLTFRVYIDRGTEIEWVADVTAYRTPTDILSKSGFTTYLSDPNYAALGTNSISFNSDYRLKQLLPKSVTTIPSILSTFSGTVSQEVTEVTSFTVVISHNDAIIKNGHKVNNIRAYNPNTGVLIASTNFKTNIIEVPATTSTFYLMYDLTLNYYNPFKDNEDIVISDNKVRASSLVYLERELTHDRYLYITEGILSDAAGINAGGSNVSNFISAVSLPESRSVSDTVSKAAIVSYGTSPISKVTTKFAAISCDAGTDTVSNAASASYASKVIQYNLIRFNGISIGG